MEKFASGISYHWLVVEMAAIVFLPPMTSMHARWEVEALQEKGEIACLKLTVVIQMRYQQQVGIPVPQRSLLVLDLACDLRGKL